MGILCSKTKRLVNLAYKYKGENTRNTIFFVFENYGNNPHVRIKRTWGLSLEDVLSIRRLTRTAVAIAILVFIF